MKNIIIFDSNWVINKTYHVLKATIPEYELSSSEHWFKTVRKCVVDICSILRSLKLKPGVDEVWFSFDRGRSFRKDLYSGYKASRPEKDPYLEPLILEMQQLLSTEFNTIYIDGLESDDLIFQLIETDKYISNRDHRMYTIVASDEDLQQLVDLQTCVFKPYKDTKTVFSIKEFFEDMDFSSSEFLPVEVNPKLILVSKLLLGCESDEIPRLLKKGIGPKTVEKHFHLVFHETKTVEQIAEDICRENGYIVDLVLLLENLLLVDLRLGPLNYSELQKKCIQKYLIEERTTKKVTKNPDEYTLSNILGDTNYVNDIIQL